MYLINPYTVDHFIKEGNVIIPILLISYCRSRQSHRASRASTQRRL